MIEGNDSVDSGQYTMARSSMEETDVVQDVSALDIGSDAFEPVLCRWHRQDVKYFCKVHMEELCTTCRRMKHKNCKPLLDLKQATKEVYSETHGEKIMHIYIAYGNSVNNSMSVKRMQKV